MGANQYRLQVDDQNDFNTPTIDITSWNITYTPLSTDQALSDGDWYWRVRVEDPSPVSAWSTVFHFTKIWAAPQNIPNLLSPSEGQELAFFDAPAFSWTAVLGAAQYRFRITQTPNYNATPILSVDTLARTYQPSERLANSTYYWHVIPIDPSNQLGTPSNIQSFIAAYGMNTIGDMVPTMISPMDESFPTFTPTFQWTAISGAEHYRLEYTDDKTCKFDTSTGIDTRQTSFTPSDPLSNDTQFCWRVRVESGPAIGDWSETWHFTKKWDLQPVLLTPTEQYLTGLYPLYSWTPDPGAARYHFQIAKNRDFNPIYEEAETANTSFTPQSKYDGTSHYYWRVWPIAGGGEYGAVSEVGEYQSNYDSLAPVLIYPMYYYQPVEYGQFIMNPHEDRTVAFPIFMWHRVMVASPVGGVYASAYRLQVDESYLFNSIDWQYDTENTSASPTKNEDFSPVSGQEYYWRVCPLTSLNDACQINPGTGEPWWSQVWKARFDKNLQINPTTGDAPSLLRPAIGQESVEATPLLEWWPLEGATEYQVEVSRDVDFITSEITETVNISAYSPKYSLAQRSLGRTDFGTFYWHVRAFTAEGWSRWSDAWRFQIAAQSEWRYIRSPGTVENRLLIGSDPVNDVPSEYDLTTLYATQSDTDWFFGFDAVPPSLDMTYVIYIDLDNITGSGATVPPERSYQVSTNPEHRPEFVIYVDDIGGIIDLQNTWVFAWDGDVWGNGKRFSEIDAGVYVNAGYIELRISDGIIGMNNDTNSASVMLFSVDTITGVLKDTVPSDPDVSVDSYLTRFSAVSDHMNLIFPPNVSSGDPNTLTSLLPFFWDWPTGSNGATPFAGSILQVDLDEDYTPPHEATFQIASNSQYFSENHVTLLGDIYGDHTYYWRVQPRYMLPGYPVAFGSWTGGWSFHRLGLTPENLHSSPNSSIISFSWDMAEGAELYHLQVATDPGFANRVVEVLTPMNSYIPQETLPQSVYYWRVQIVRFEDIANTWVEGEPFEFILPQPQGLTPASGEVIHGTPTYCWNPVEAADDAGNAFFSAWRYHIQVSTDPSFRIVYDSIDTYNNCWTPFKGYIDGNYYWRVALYDGNGRLGSYSPAATFTKLYASPTLISPIKGKIQSTPTFVWSPVTGAATYAIEVSWYPTFYPLYDVQETLNTQYTPIWNYALNKVYYWRVAIRDHDGLQGPFVAARIILGNVYFLFNPFISK
ncbi:MAG: hypothetical protein FIA98_11985 [Anaerolineae bacterium]|nr:hypothetical protein [Anaerolineae bacterium]